MPINITSCNSIRIILINIKFKKINVRFFAISFRNYFINTSHYMAHATLGDILVFFVDENKALVKFQNL